MSLTTRRIRGYLAPVSAALSRPLEWTFDRVESRAAVRQCQDRATIRLTCVFLQWDPLEGPRELNALSDRLRACAGVDVTIVLVDNRSPHSPSAQNAKATLIVGGDNRAWEFSGFEAGVDATRAHGVTTDVWLLANDRYRADRRPFLECLTGATVRATYEIGGIVGHIDAYPRSVATCGTAVQRWVNTSFVLLADKTLRDSEPLVSIEANDLDAILSPSGHPMFRPDGPVGDQHASYLLAWLTGSGGTDLTTRWYGAAPRGQLASDVLRRKVQSILNEQLLSAKALARGTPLVPIQTAYRLGILGLQAPAVRRAIADIQSRPRDHPLVLGRRAARLRLVAQIVLSRLTVPVFRRGPIDP